MLRSDISVFWLRNDIRRLVLLFLAIIHITTPPHKGSCHNSQWPQTQHGTNTRIPLVSYCFLAVGLKIFKVNIWPAVGIRVCLAFLLCSQIATDCRKCHTFAALFCAKLGCNFPDTAFEKEVCALLRTSFRSLQTKGETQRESRDRLTAWDTD